MNLRGWESRTMGDVRKNINVIIEEGLAYVEVRNRVSKDALANFIGNPNHFLETPPCLQTGFFALCYYLKKYSISLYLYFLLFNLK